MFSKHALHNTPEVKPRGIPLCHVSILKSDSSNGLVPAAEAN